MLMKKMGSDRDGIGPIPSSYLYVQQVTALNVTLLSGTSRGKTVRVIFITVYNNTPLEMNRIFLAPPPHHHPISTQNSQSCAVS